MGVMSLALIAFQLSVVASVFAIGLSTSSGDLYSLLRRPGLLFRSLLAINVIMLVAVIALIRIMHPSHLVVAALVAMALAPMPPVLPKSMVKAGGEASYASGLLAISGLLSLVWIPFGFHILAALFGLDLGVPSWPVVKMVLITILAPLVAGALLARHAPAIANRVRGPIAAVGGLVLAAALLFLVVIAWRQIQTQIGEGAVLAIMAFAVFGLLVGHLLGGPISEERTVLALACALRHPGIVVVLGTIAFPDEKGMAALGLMALIIPFVCCLPYIVWRKRARTAGEVPR